MIEGVDNLMHAVYPLICSWRIMSLTQTSV